jgi:hypothetical protein
VINLTINVGSCYNICKKYKYDKENSLSISKDRYVFNHLFIIMIFDIFKATRISIIVKVTLQLTVSQSVCQGIEPTLRLVTRYYFLSEGCLKVAVLSL